MTTCVVAASAFMMEPPGFLVHAWAPVRRSSALEGYLAVMLDQEEPNSALAFLRRVLYSPQVILPWYKA